MLQDTFLFNGIAENIDYGVAHASAEQIEQAARIAHAAFYHVRCPRATIPWWGGGACACPAGRSSASPSHGRCCATRPSLIWTGATSAVDTETEAEIQDAIEALRLAHHHRHRHRLSTVMRADQILVLKEGDRRARQT